MKHILSYFLFYLILSFSAQGQKLKHYQGEYDRYNQASMFRTKTHVDYYYYKGKHGTVIYQNNFFLTVQDQLVDSLVKLTMSGSFDRNLKNNQWTRINYKSSSSPEADTITGYFTHGARSGIWTNSKGLQITFENNSLTGDINYVAPIYEGTQTLALNIRNNLVSGTSKIKSDDHESEVRYFKGFVNYFYSKDLQLNQVLDSIVLDTNIIHACIKDIESKKAIREPYPNQGTCNVGRLYYMICYSEYDNKKYKIEPLPFYYVSEDIYEFARTFDQERGSLPLKYPVLYFISEYTE